MTSTTRSVETGVSRNSSPECHGDECPESSSGKPHLDEMHYACQLQWSWSQAGQTTVAWEAPRHVVWILAPCPNWVHSCEPKQTRKPCLHVHTITQSFCFGFLSLRSKCHKWRRQRIHSVCIILSIYVRVCALQHDVIITIMSLQAVYGLQHHHQQHF